MKKISIILIVVNLLLLLAYFNYSIAQKEDNLKEGKLVLLELAPVDPRSLMQGDYMMLNYKLNSNVQPDSIPRRGYAVLKLDNHQVGELQRFQAEKTPLAPGEVLIHYTNPSGWRVNIGAESFFFQEGTGERFEKAKYGALKVDDNGNSLLIGLYDEDKREIKSK
ncbi:MAG: GDYXXLXY domain-containing protein [Sphingobacterium hotanense]